MNRAESDALAADRNGDMVRAAQLYDEALESGGASEELCLRAAGLFWQACDFGVATDRQLPVEFVRYAGTRTFEILEHSCRAFPQSPRVQFWNKYIRWSELGEPLTSEECEEWLVDHPECPDPVVFLYVLKRSSIIDAAVRATLDWAVSDGSTWAHYAEAVLRYAESRWRSSEGRD